MCKLYNTRNKSQYFFGFCFIIVKNFIQINEHMDKCKNILYNFINKAVNPSIAYVELYCETLNRA